MRIEHMREFLALAGNPNLSEVARELYTTQPSLSRHISSMETELGVDLFAHDSGGMSLTPIGTAFREYANDIVALYNRALSDVENMKESQRGLLRIGYLYDGVYDQLRRIREAMIQDESARPFDIKFVAGEQGELSEKLERDEIDIAFILDFGTFESPVFEKQALGMDRYCLIAPKDHPLVHAGTPSLENLKDLRVILPDPVRMKDAHRFLTRNLAERNVSFGAVSYYDDIPSFAFEVSCNSGVGLMLEHHRAHYDDMIAFLPIASDPITCPFCCVWKKKVEPKLPENWENIIRGMGKKARKEWA